MRIQYANYGVVDYMVCITNNMARKFLLVVLVIFVAFSCAGCQIKEDGYNFMQSLENVKQVQFVRYYEEWDKYPEEMHIGQIPPSFEVIKVLETEAQEAFLGELQQLQCGKLTWGEPNFINRGDTQYNGVRGVMIIYENNQYEITLVKSMQIRYYGTYYNRLAEIDYDSTELGKLMDKYL